MKTLLSIGNATWDQTFITDNLTNNATKCYATGFNENGGGVAATAATTASLLGCSSSFIGRFGHDFVGERILDELKSLGVNCEFCITYAHAKSSIATVVLNEGNSSKIYVYNDSNMPRDTSKLFDINLSDIAVIVSDMTWPEGTQVLFERAQLLGIPTLLRVSFFNQDYLPIMKLADICVFNHPSLLAMTSDIQMNRSLKKVSNRIGGSIVVSCGARGGAWLHEGGFGQTKPNQVDVVSDLGAGDVLLGALGVYLAQGLSFPDAVSNAHIVASESCRHKTPRELNKYEILKVLEVRS